MPNNDMLKTFILICIFLIGCTTMPNGQRGPLDLEQEIYLWTITDFCPA